MGFYISEIVKCLDTNGHDSHVDVFTADGKIHTISKDSFDGLFKSTDTPADADKAYDFHLQPGDVLELSADQVTEIQNAETLQEAEAIVEQAITDKVEPQTGETTAVATTDNTTAPANTTTAQ